MIVLDVGNRALAGVIGITFRKAESDMTSALNSAPPPPRSQFADLFNSDAYQLIVLRHVSAE